MIIDLSVIVPLFNEEETLPLFYPRLKKSVSPITKNYEFIFVNDGSQDKTFEQLKQLAQKDHNVKYINFSRNFGHQIAVTAGLDKCCGNAVVIIDGDLQDPPELIPELYEQYQKGYDVVYAKRNSRKGETMFKKTTAKLFYRILKKLSSIDIPLDTGDFRLIDKKVVENLRLMPEHNKFLRGQIAWLGFNQTFVKFDREERAAGKTGYPLKKMLNFALDGITAFSDKPLKFVRNMGIVISLLALVIIIYALISHFILHETITGWTSLIISFVFFGGIQLIAIGIIGEYIARISNNVRNRPLYVISETNIE